VGTTNIFFHPENGKDLNVFENNLHESYTLYYGHKDSKVIKQDMKN